ncbi:TonB-dependent receptor domain-containing protein [Moraxella oblonga]|uniref:TonB-dependent receptor domain-containing protein n=1 Tax=Moraxella oblonga TaxID=200413 RepID=UPI000835B9EB|nr:TonB-dependent receptor [Moraxella oblonga]
MQTRYFHLTMLTLTVCTVMYSAWADDTPTVNLEGITIQLAKKPKDKMSETTVTRQQLNQENIQNSHDLVRYNTEVDVAEVGRYGNKGFAIRGVDGNRVAMNVDGVALPEVEVNEIFSPYGYMYEGRFNPDLEMMGRVNITAGADSLLSGSGAVGGSVAYNTKNPNNLVYGDKNLGGYAKLGYTNKNEELLSAVGLAGVYDRTEFLINYARREGHELKNHDMISHKKEIVNNLAYIFSEEELPSGLKSLRHPNAMSAKQDSALAKFYYHLNDNHRIGVHGIYQQKNTVMNTDINASYGSRTSLDPRRAKDKEEMTSYGANYRYRPSDSFLDELNFDYTKSKVLGVADTWVYDRNWLGVIDFDRREYRPTTTKTDQYRLNLKFLPIDFGKFGEHRLELSGGLAKADRSTSATVLKEDGSPNYLNYTFSDVKKDNYHLALTDFMTFGNRLNAMAGVRYDNHKYKPYFENDVFGYDENARVYQTCVTNNASGGFCENYRLGESLKNTKYSHTTWSGMLDYAVIPDRLNARYKIGTGFLAPTGTQIYRNFQGLGVLEVPNYHLKPETSLNQELEFEFRPTKNTALTVSGYLSKYDNFIHTKFWEGNTGGCNGRSICLQSVNLDTAKVHGVKVGIEADLSEKLKTNGKFSVLANYHTAKDSAEVETDYDGRFKINTLAATPTSLILGADYVSANKDWSLHTRVRGIRAKKAEDTKGIDVAPKYKNDIKYCKDDPFYAWYGSFYCSSADYLLQDNNGDFYKNDRTLTGYTEYVSTYKHADRSKDVVLVDLYGTKKFGKDNRFILNGGIYNLTDAKYIPWESLRMFSNANVNNMVDRDGNGFNRYTAPGRNYAISLTYEF